MASEVDICNLALGHLGDNATVASINPPEGSAQAEHCKRFYPIARDTLLEMHNWNFAMRRVALTPVTMSWPEWQYAYVLPADVLNAISVIPNDAAADYSTSFNPTDTPGWSMNYSPTTGAGRYVPQEFTIETTSAGIHNLFCNLENAVLRYSAYVTDTTEFSPLFIVALSWHLASMLAGPVIKGDMGTAEGKRCVQMMSGFMAQAKASDANQRNIKVDHIVPWTAGR